MRKGTRRATSVWLHIYIHAHTHADADGHVYAQTYTYTYIPRGEKGLDGLQAFSRRQAAQLLERRVDEERAGNQ